KRKRIGQDPQSATPKKPRRDLSPQELGNEEEVQAETPSRRRGGMRSAVKDPKNADTLPNSTPKSQRRVLFATPSKKSGEVEESPSGKRSTLAIVRNSDNSARRKSNRRLIEQTINSGELSDEEASETEDILAQQIWAEDDDNEEEEEAEVNDEDVLLDPDTPSKRRRGRPKKKQRKRSPTPPTNLPSYEQYFYQNRPGASKTSSNTFPSGLLLNHDEYFEQVDTYADPHDPEKEYLHSLHSRSFDQWLFELNNGFNICLYGYGSKRAITEKFAAHAYQVTSKPSKIVVMNGYSPDVTVRDVLDTVAADMFPRTLKLPAQPPALLQIILETLSSKPPASPILIILNSIDAPPLRNHRVQSVFAALSGHPSVSLLATADTPTFPLLWDLSLRGDFRFAFHDCTTFESYSSEVDVVTSINELLGRSGRRVQGRDGVAFVLKSLPENARSLYRVLVAEQVAAVIEAEDTMGSSCLTNGHLGIGDGDLDRAGITGDGIEYRLLYRKAHEELICTNESGFRTLLKEFFDHRMVESRRDGAGTERLIVPFRQEELEGLLVEL
ncbi:ORC2-domain-containing protein, partial [Aulographum hederae CBS 113979]